MRLFPDESKAPPPPPPPAKRQPPDPDDTGEGMLDLDEEDQINNQHLEVR